jgi:hypothetical protein
MRVTTDSDWTMVTSKDCYRCNTKAYDRSASTTATNGTFFNTTADGPLKYAGNSVKDTVCVGGGNKAKTPSPCVDNFEFFVISNDTEHRTYLQRCDGIMGLAPDNDDNGPSYLTSLRNMSLINHIQVSFRMRAQAKEKSRLVFGGVDPANMLPYPSKEKPEFYWYDNIHDDKEWGTEMRNMYIGDTPLDSGVRTYARIDPLQQFIQVSKGYYQKYMEYMKANHTEMECIDGIIGFGICKTTNKSCESIIGNYTNITLRFNDSKAFVIPPKSYLYNEVTASGINICYSLIVGRYDLGESVILGDIFMENYHVVVDFDNTTIGINGWVIDDLPVEP